MKKDIIFDFLAQEQQRQECGINLIASENYAPEDVRALVGSVLMNKYVEGYPGARYYAGCQFIDDIEAEAINQFKKLFQAEHVNVQPHAGSQANFAVYFALLNPGDTILSMKLSDGGHLTHGHAVNMSGKLYNIVFYGVDPKTHLIDYDQVQNLAQQHKPKLIIAGASSYPRVIDFERFSKIAKTVQAYFMADVAHTAGLIAAGMHPSPVPWADVVTMTTQKTFRGPKGGVILCKKNLAVKIDKAVMPGTQGGAFMHEIAAKAVACAHAATIRFAAYQKKVIENAQIMAKKFMQLGYSVISGGTDTHMLLIDVRPLKLNGKEVEELLESINIFVNRNVIPGDTEPPLLAGGIRLGTAAVTTRGAREKDCEEIVKIIDAALQKKEDAKILQQKVHAMTKQWQKIKG
ncbi:serine hydroxymethyltransferase [candidate division TM6 bacterium RIFCSPHIGHO2_12_FULL_38_8]|nr:MAG: serine hydroxymethyltransferase [candidate division TM6 bacterium RIFCSPHIGHO2_12_FULL_38_8]